ncbi:MvaI/BcnI family restriction endonuclease [Thiofilum flexile]|uniref:MvaI/BcnI family restriction endonuclease n=1 Tax=Thiofilum flexile TaxID=125627 RepID=UPI00037D24F5|nr:MvaI/BcnI family restriction endonuclease [Thiofilum flexile]
MISKVILDNSSNVLNNRATLVELGIDFAIFWPTKTGLDKSILDATNPVRALFTAMKLHDYSNQAQGPEAKCKYTAIFVASPELIITEMTAYRPQTKKGDPRMWFKYLKDFANAGDAIAITIYDKTPYLFNLSQITLSIHQNTNDHIGQILKRLAITNNIAQDLLNKLRTIARRGAITSPTSGDTAIGIAIELALGIPTNSSKKPDYFGIEIKSARSSKSSNRSNLFAQVPNWQKSILKSSREILEKYGYQRNNDHKLYCTIQALKPNSQGLYLTLAENQEILFEKHIDDGDVVLWEAETLRQRLVEKHTETFWIEADSSFDKQGQELFYLKSITHTKAPLQSQLMPLLAEGIITVDHLIKRKGSNGQVSEKGPLFKINPEHLALLFPQPVKYELITP